MNQPYLLTWNNGYQRFSTFKEMKDFCVYNGLSNMCYRFSDDNYDTDAQEYCTGNIPGTGRMRNVKGFYQPEIVEVTVYLDTVKSDYDELKDGENLIDIELPKDVLMDWYFKEFDEGNHEMMTDEEAFEQWLAKYTADDTVNLYEDLKAFITLPKMEVA